MEIIHVILGKANPERMNGVNKVVYQLATKQAEAGKKVSVWGITKDPTHNYGERNFETRLFKAQKNPFSIDPELTKSIASKMGNAVFHIHGGWIPTFYSISKLLSNANISFVFTPHGAYNTIAIQKTKWLKKLYFYFFEKQLLKRAYKIHCIGQSEVDGLTAFYKTDKTILLPYGFERIEKNPVLANKNETAFTIGFVGRLDIYTKGLDLLLEAFTKYLNLDTTARLWIIGDSNERSNLENLIKEKNISNQVSLWGSKFGKEKDELMHQLHVFTHPSRNEGLPSAVLEAASMGIPCIVSEATNMGDMIRTYNCGIVIKNNDADALFQAIIAMKEQWKHDKLAHSGSNAIHMVDTAFNWNMIVEKFDTLYS